MTITRLSAGRPWLLAHLRTSLIAASLASVPELHRNTFCAKRDAVTSSSASFSGGALKNTLLVCHSLPACSVSAAIRSGSLCPNPLTAMPEDRSRYSRPWSSHTRLPWPRSSTT